MANPSLESYYTDWRGSLNPSDCDEKSQAKIEVRTLQHIHAKKN